MITNVGAKCLQCVQIIHKGIGEICEDVEVQRVVPSWPYTQGEVNYGPCWMRCSNFNFITMID